MRPGHWGFNQFCKHSAWMVWKKEMEGGKVALLLMNNQNFSADVNISWTDLPDDMHFRCSAGGCPVRDIFAHTDLGLHSGGFTAKNVAPHDSAFVVVQQCKKEATYPFRCLAATTSAQAVPNNRRPNLLPPAGGAWRGAELGSQFLSLAPTAVGSGGSGGDKLAAYRHAYPSTPLHVYRSFNLTIGPGVREWVAQGGILWYNIKTGKQMSWAKGASGGFDEEARGWAAQVRSLAPAQVFVTIFHEPDHNVCFSKCTGNSVPGNTPANYRNMWRSIQAVFKAEQVMNVVWVIDFSVQIGNISLMNEECTEASCPAAAAVAPLYPGDDAIDWVFYNLFEKGKKHDRIKADFATMLAASTAVLRNANTSQHCHCVPGRDAHCHGCDLASKPWGLGAFASHGLSVDGKPPVDTEQRVKFFQDATAAMKTHTELKAYLYFDSLDSAVPLNGSEPEVEAAFAQYLASPPFTLGDAGAPPAQGLMGVKSDDVSAGGMSFVDRFETINWTRWDWRGSFMLGGHGSDAYMALPDASHLQRGADGLTMIMNDLPCATNKSACCCSGKHTIPCVQQSTESDPDQRCAQFATGHLLSNVSYGFGVYEAAIQFSGAKGAVSFFDIGEHELCGGPHEETQFYYTGGHDWSEGHNGGRYIKTG